MILWLTILIPILSGALIWLLPLSFGRRLKGNRAWAGTLAVAALITQLVMVLFAMQGNSETSLEWGAGLRISLYCSDPGQWFLLLLPLAGITVCAWTAAHEAEEGLERLVGLQCLFIGVMALLILSNDLLTLAIAWELVSFLSWAMINHEWQDADKTSAANYAFNATRVGGIGLWIAAAACISVTGNLHFSSLETVAAGPWKHAMAGGILLAAVSKSAQVPFSPWLFKAMKGPTPVSALLHSATMVAAGVWLLIRLHEPLSAVGWYTPAAILVGLLTALTGGFVAIFQLHAKYILAGSTSAHFGLMVAAAGAGFPGAALLHLIAHALFKIPLFMAAGIASSATGSFDVRGMQLGRHMRVLAWATLVAALALAAIPPLGGAWTKEHLVAATGHVAPWLAVLTMIIATMSTWYALRFYFLVMGRRKEDDRKIPPPGAVVKTAIWIPAMLCLVLGLLWIPGSRHWAGELMSLEVPKGKTWELVLSMGIVIMVSALAVWHFRWRSRNNFLEFKGRQELEDWAGLPFLIGRTVTRPLLIGSHYCSELDRRWVDGGVRLTAATARMISSLVSLVFESDLDHLVDRTASGTLRLADASREKWERFIDAMVDGLAQHTGTAGTHTQRFHGGAIPTYYSLLAGGTILTGLLLVFWR